MRILEAQLSDVSYCEDFGRVEAMVTLLVKTRTGQPPHTMRLRTSQPLHGQRPLEDRMIDDAIQLAMRIDQRALGQNKENMRLAA